jgi:MATE family multidrug resistance protein
MISRFMERLLGKHGVDKYSSASLLQLLSVSFPLVLSLLSGSLMFFTGRLLLASYSIEAHNAAVSAGLMVACLEFPFICIVSIAEVFVGQSNGAGQKQRLAIPVWQMIWLSLLSALFFIPVAYFFSETPFAQSQLLGMESAYFSYLIYFSPAFCLAAALSAFYIGRGSVLFVTITVIVSNILNLVVAYALIFGIDPYIPSMGITGAAIATGVAQVFQALVLFVDFLRSSNRRTYGTANYHFVWKEFARCIRIGIPSSVAHTVEIFAWTLFFRMLIGIGPEHATVVSIAQTIFFLFTFMTEGISKGATALAANFIGAGRQELVWKLLNTGIRLYLLLFIALGIPLVVCPTSLIHLFINPAEIPDGDRIFNLVRMSCFWVWLFFLLDGIHWLVVGLLTAAGDTKFVFKIGSSIIWVCVILPTYLLVVCLGLSPDFAWAITVFYGLTASVVYLFRLYSGEWKFSARRLLASE